MSEQFEVNEDILIEGVSLRGLFISPTHYEFFAGWLRQQESAKAAASSALEASYKSEIETLEDQLAELDHYRAEVDRLGSLLADMTAKRDAAAEEVEDLKAEVKRLTTDNESLRKQLESKGVTGPTNINANLAELAKQIQAQKPGIYDKKWKDENRKTHYIAKLSATGEEIEIPYLEIGKYREESPEDAARFRQEAEEKAAREALEAAAESAEAPPITEDTFQEEDAEISADPIDGKVAPETVSRDEFEALRERVARLEQQANDLKVA